jgi:hypothetical protein
MSSKNRPSIQSLIGAIANGLNPSQTSDLVQKIADDLDEVHSWIDTGPIPRALTSEELGGNIAYTDKYDAFEVGIGITGIDPSGVINAGDIIFDAVKGFVIKLKAGSTDDFELLDPSGNVIINIPTGTKTPIFNNGLQITGTGINTPGAISKSAAFNGLQIVGITGAVFDFAILNPAVSLTILGVPTGTTDLQYQGNFIQSVGKYLEILERADPANGPADSGRLYCRDNGAGKTQLCIRFNTGAAIVIATQV